MHRWNIFGAWTSHGQTRTHKTHHGLDLGEATTFSLIVFFYAWPWDNYPNVILSQDSQVEVLKFPKLGLSRFWRPIILCVDLWLRWCLNKIRSPCRIVFNDMWHTTYTQGNWGDSWFLMVNSQIDNLTFDLSFGHNVCFKYPNGSCEPISDIFVSRDFQWYK